MSRFCTGLAFVLMTTTAAQAATVVLSDGDFDTWVATPLAGFGVGQTAAVQPTGGNPDAFYAVTTTTGGVTVTHHLSPGMTYNPAAGAIESILFSIDFNAISAFGQGQSIAFLASQGGSMFVVDATVTGSNSAAGWQSKTTGPVIDPAAFSRDSGTGTLDFSATAAPITFGIRTANSGGNGITIGYDNFSATLTVEDSTVVPLPAPLGLALFGVGALGLVSRRSHKAS